MIQPLVQNAADEAQVREAGGKVSRARARDLDDMRVVLSTKQGRRTIWRYLEACGVFALSFNHSGSITAFNEGARNIGLKLLADIHESAPELYPVMQSESKET